VGVDSQVFGHVLVFVFQFGEQSFVGQVERVRMFPVVTHDAVQAFDDFVVVYFDGKLVGRMVLVGAVFLAVMYVFVRLFVNWG